MRKIISSVLVVLAIGIVIWFGNKSNSENSPFIIGYIGPLTGPSAVLGMDAVKALEIAVGEVNQNGGMRGIPVKLVAEDDQYLTKTTVSAYEKLVHTDGAKIILVANYGGVLALKDKALKDNVIVIDPLDCNDTLADATINIFCLATETESIGTSLADYMILNKKTRASIMYSTKDSFMSIVKDSFEKRFEEQGGVVHVESFNYDVSDFRTQLSKIKQENPDALVLLGHDETGIIMKQAREIGIKAPFLATGTITSPNAQKASNGNAEGTVFAYWEKSPDNKLAKDFENKFVALVGRPPILPLTTHPAYDTLKVLFEKVLPLSTDTDKIRENLLKVRGYNGTTGQINFEDDGGARIPESVYKLVNGAPVKI